MYVIEVWRGRSAVLGIAPYAYIAHEEYCYIRKDAEKKAKDIESTDADIVCIIKEVEHD